MDIWIYYQFLHTIYDGYITGDGTYPTDFWVFGCYLQWSHGFVWEPSERSALEPAGGVAAVLAVTPLSSAAGSSAMEEGCLRSIGEICWMIVSFWKLWIDYTILYLLFYSVLQCIRCRNHEHHEQLGLCMILGEITAQSWPFHTHYGDIISISEEKKSPMMGWNWAQWYPWNWSFTGIQSLRIRDLGIHLFVCLYYLYWPNKKEQWPC